MTKAETKRQAQGAIAEVRAMHPGKRFMFCCVEAGGRQVLACLVEGEDRGPMWPAVPEAEMWALQVACNEALGITEAVHEEIMASVGHSQDGKLTIKKGRTGDLTFTRGSGRPQ